MQSIKRDLLFGLSMCALVFLTALACGRPFIRTTSDSIAGPVGSHSPQSVASTETFAGTVGRVGDQFVLLDSTGQVYKLDDARRARRFEGKAARVTGSMDTSTRTIYVESIESIAA